MSDFAARTGLHTGGDARRRYLWTDSFAVFASAHGEAGVRRFVHPLVTIPKCSFTPEIGERDGRVMLTLHIKIKRHDNRRVLVAPDGRDLYLTYTPGGELVPQPHLVRAIGQAFAWHRGVTAKGAVY